MEIRIEEVKDQHQFALFINFPYQLYKGNSCYVPPLRFDEVDTLSKDKNPAFDYCEARYWLAFRQNKVVGRIAGIINHSYIKKWKNEYMRFGWIDFVDDLDVARLLLKQVEDWAIEKRMTAVHGPMGFTDLDHEGMLIQGFDQLGTLATIYNFPYYPELLKKIGYSKDIDWLEYKITLPKTVPEKLEKIAAIVKRRLDLQIVPLRKAKDILPYAPEIFKLINTSYAELYGVIPLTEKQIEYYTKQYFSFIRTDFVSLVTDASGKLAAFSITMPSLSRALQKANGKLLPFGFIHLLRALRKNKLGDLYLIAVRKDLQGKGVNALMMYELTKSYIKFGIEYAESNPELEDNKQVQALWEYYEVKQHKRRRCFIKHL